MKKSQLVLIVVFFCALGTMNISEAYTVSTSGYANVSYPNTPIVYIPQDPSNLTASGYGSISYTVITSPGEVVTLYEKVWMYLDSYSFYASDPITFSAGSTTNGVWNTSAFVTGLVGVGSHSATFTMSFGNPSSYSDTHSFQVALVPEPISSILFLAGGATLVFKRYCRKKGYPKGIKNTV